MVIIPNMSISILGCNIIKWKNSKRLNTNAKHCTFLFSATKKYDAVPIYFHSLFPIIVCLCVIILVIFPPTVFLLWLKFSIFPYIWSFLTKIMTGPGNICVGFLKKTELTESPA